MVKVIIYEPGYEEEIVSLWNKCLYRDPINIEVFERKILLDPNFSHDGFLIAIKDGKPVGFAYNVVRRYPLLKDEDERDKDRGWIVAFGVDPAVKGSEVGDILIEKSLEYHRKMGRRIVLYSPYIPNYFFPGIDVEAYPYEYSILLRHGFTEVAGAESYAMDADLWPDFKFPEDILEKERRLKLKGIEIVKLSTKYIYPFMSFMKNHMPADWYRHARELLLHNRKEQIIIAVKDGEVVGYCQFWNGEGYSWHAPGAHFGPFGVRDDMRGMGIGSVLLYRCLVAMREYGIHRAFLLWTGERARRLYERFGFRVTRRFKIMRKVLG